MAQVSRQLLALLVAGTFALAGCGGGGGGDEPAEPPPPPWPLTGLPGPPSDSQVITVKIENTAAGRPQLGLGEADIVVEELVEGGLTRLAAMFHTQFAGTAGPVRSMRESDIGIVLPTSGTLAASGGAPSTVSEIRGAGVNVVVDGAPGFSSDQSRRVPYNLMLDVAALAETLPSDPPPQPYLPFGEVPGDATGSPAGEVDLRWPAALTTMQYNAATGTWQRTTPATDVGDGFTNVIALTVPVTFLGDTDAAGSQIPTMVTTGVGTGVIATGGMSYDVTWTKESPTAPWTFSYVPPGDQAAPQPFTVPPGRSWVALLPPDGGRVTVTPPVPTSTG